VAEDADIALSINLEKFNVNDENLCKD